MSCTKIFKIYSKIFVILAFIWWPVTHWFFADWYHGFLGFETYDDALVKLIGTLTTCPILGLCFVALNPEKNRDLFITIMIASVLNALTLMYLIFTGPFPPNEWLNVGLLLGNTGLLCFLYPWKA